MRVLHSVTAYESDPDCKFCAGTGLVCEVHPVPWENDDCCGAPGMPCPCSRWECGSVGTSCACIAADIFVVVP